MRGYIKTKVGWIPEDWKVVKLSHYIERLSAGVSVNSQNQTIKNENQKGILKTSAVYGYKFNAEENKLINDEEILRAKLNPRGGNIIISRMNTPELVGACGFVEETLTNLYLPDRLWQTTFNYKYKDSGRWVYYLLVFSKYRRRINRLGTGTSDTMKNISKNSFLNVKVPLPPLAEQQKIATILSTWDKAIDRLSALMEAKVEQKKGLMQRLLTGKVRIKGFYHEWKTMKLKETFKERREIGHTGLELLSIGSKGVYPQSESNKKDTSNKNKDKYKRICKGDIGYNTMRMWQGRSAISNVEGIVSPAYTIVTPKEGHHVRFYGYLFHTPDLIHRFWRYSQGLVGDTLNCKFKNFSKVKVLVPPTIEEQKEIAAVLDQLSLEIKTLEKKRNIYELEKKGLMQRLLTGKTRVKIK